MREFGVRRPLHQPFDALTKTEPVVGDVEEVIVRVRVRRQCRGRDLIQSILGEQLRPFRQAPFVEEFGLVIEKVLNLLAVDYRGCHTRPPRSRRSSMRSIVSRTHASAARRPWTAAL